MRRFIPLGETWLVLIAVVLLLAISAGAIAALAPSVGEQVRHLRAELPRSFAAAGDYLMQFSWGRELIGQLPDLSALWENILSGGVLSRVGGIFTSTVGAVGNLLILILLAIYFAVEPRFYVDGIVRLFPIASRDAASRVFEQIGTVLTWWLVGKVGSMLFVGIVTWIALSILGVPMALTLGLIAGLLSFIPNFGPILSAIPAVLIAFVESPMSAVYVVIILIGVQIVESNIVTPLIERETIELPPGLTIVFQLGLATLVGGLGLVLATPLLAVVMVIVQMVYIQGVLGDKDTPAIEVDVAAEEKA
jgi:predicted PurR-regulated permease PerM